MWIKMVTRHLLDLSDVLEDILDEGDNSALVDSEDEELQDEFIYVN